MCSSRWRWVGCPLGGTFPWCCSAACSGDRKPTTARFSPPRSPKPARSSLLREKLLAALAPAEATLQSLETAGGLRGGDGSAVGQSPLRILYAEDNAVNQRVGQIMLGKLGHRVDTVTDGRQALAAVRARRYDGVLMDVQMPTTDGLQATRQIRAELPAERQPWIVAITASVLIEDRQACAEAGMDDYLAKPVRGQELRSALSKVRPPATGTTMPGPVRAEPARHSAPSPRPSTPLPPGPRSTWPYWMRSAASSMTTTGCFGPNC